MQHRPLSARGELQSQHPFFLSVHSPLGALSRLPRDLLSAAPDGASLRMEGSLFSMAERSAGIGLSQGDIASNRLETALGSYPLTPGSDWSPGWDPLDQEDIADDPPQHPNIWTDGSRDTVPGTKIEVGGAGTLVQQADVVFDNHHQGHLQDIGTDIDSKSRIFCSVPGATQTLQRAGFWRVILALQTLHPAHPGTDDKYVFQCAERLLRPGRFGVPLALTKDGDLAAHIQYMLRIRDCKYG